MLRHAFLQAGARARQVAETTVRSSSQHVTADTDRGGNIIAAGEACTTLPLQFLKCGFAVESTVDICELLELVLSVFHFRSLLFKYFSDRLEVACQLRPLCLYSKEDVVLFCPWMAPFFSEGKSAHAGSDENDVVSACAVPLPLRLIYPTIVQGAQHLHVVVDANGLNQGNRLERRSIMQMRETKMETEPPSDLAEFEVDLVACLVALEPVAQGTEKHGKIKPPTCPFPFIM